MDGAMNCSATAIAIVGMAGRFPKAGSPEELWKRLCNGEDCISFLTDEELQAAGIDRGLLQNPKYVKAAPVVENIEYFDAHFFGITPREAELMDPQQRIFMECCWEALETAGYDPFRFPGDIGLWAGARTDTYLINNLVSHSDLVESVGAFHLGLGNDLAFLTTRISHAFNLRGPSCSLHVACSTSLVAVHLACQSLLIDECQMALAGGIALNVPHKTGYLYEEGSVMSPDGHCRVFDAKARGTVFGSGVGVVVLKRLEDALADGDTIHAVIKGSAINNDGSAKASFTAPGIQGQIRVIREAQQASGVEPESISYVECHGTGTLLGDAVEVRALSKAFGTATQKQGYCALGSVKSNVGHLDAAAGVTGLIKVVMSLKHGQLPPSLHYEEANPQIDFRQSPFYVNTRLREWKRENGNGPRRAGVSAFGVGGTNAHVVVEEAPAPKAGEKGRDWQLLTLSARTETALQQGMKNLLEYLERAKPEKQEEQEELADVGYTLQVGRKQFGWRWSGVCRSREEAVEQLRGGLAACGGEGSGVEEGSRKVAFLFPGQGSQYAGMGAELYENEAVFRRSLQESSEILKPHLGLDLCRALYEEKSAEVNETYLAQAALVAVEYGLVELWKSWGVEPEAMLGHSVGEYTAACVAGVMSREEVLAVVAARGRLMQKMPRGGMVAVASGEKELSWAEEKGFSIAAVNAPGMSVLAGRVEEIEELERELQVRGVEYKRLKTSHAFHSRLVEPMMGEFLEEMKKVRLKAPEKRFISNVTGSWIRDEEAQDAGYWVKHLRERVEFGRGVKGLVESGEWMLVESGPGESLRRLAQRQGGGGMAVSSLPGMAGEGRRGERGRGRTETEVMLGAVGRLWQEGIGINWMGLHAGTQRRRVPLPTYSFERKRYWIDPASPLKQTRTVTTASTKKISDVSQWFWQPSWKLSSAKPAEPLQPDAETAWLIFSDGKGLGHAVASRLEDNGYRVIKVSRGEKFHQHNAFSYTIAPSNIADYAELIASLRNSGWSVGNLLHLWGMDSEVQPGSKADRLEECEENGLLSLLYIVQAMIAQHTKGRHHLWVAGSNTMQVESTDSVMPEKTGALAFCKVLPQEDQSFVTHGIDISPIRCAEDLDAAAECLFRELQTPATDAVVAWRGPNRWVQVYEPIQVRKSSQPSKGLKTEGVYMITGGLGAVGLLIAEWIARAVRGKLLLVGRSPIPSRSKWEEIVRQAAQTEQSRRIEKLLALERMGAEVEIVQADVCDVMQMRQAVERCRERFGRLDGVIHGAGITSGPTVFRLACDVRAEDCETQAGPKAVGLMVLEEVLAGSDVDFVMCLSSNASVLGGLGFTAYAAANLFMDAFVQRKQFERSKTRWLSTNWDHWPEETKKIANVHTTLDEFAMTREEAEQAFFTALGLGLTGQIIVATGDLQQRANLWINQQQGKDSAESKPGSDAQTKAPRPKVRTAYVAPGNEAEEALAAIWQESLGLEKIGVNDDFFELGGHSLLATKFLVQIRETFGVDFPLAKFFEGPTIAQMASYLMEIAAEDASSADESFTAQSAVG